MSDAAYAELLAAKQLVDHELQIAHARAEHWRALCDWAYQRSRKALMMDPLRPREARDERERALCEINYKIGAAVR